MQTPGKADKLETEKKTESNAEVGPEKKARVGLRRSRTRASVYKKKQDNFTESISSNLEKLKKCFKKEISKKSKESGKADQKQSPTSATPASSISAESSPAKLSSAQPSPAKSSSAQPSPDQTSPVPSGSGQPGPSQPNSAQQTSSSQSSPIKKSEVNPTTQTSQQAKSSSGKDPSSDATSEKTCDYVDEKPSKAPKQWQNVPEVQNEEEPESFENDTGKKCTAAVVHIREKRLKWKSEVKEDEINTASRNFRTVLRLMMILKRNNYLEEALNKEQNTVLQNLFERGLSNPQAEELDLLDKAMDFVINTIIYREQEIEDVIDIEMRHIILSNNLVKQLMLDVLLVYPEYLPLNWGGKVVVPTTPPSMMGKVISPDCKRVKLPVVTSSDNEASKEIGTVSTAKSVSLNSNSASTPSFKEFSEK